MVDDIRQMKILTTRRRKSLILVNPEDFMIHTLEVFLFRGEGGGEEREKYSIRRTGEKTPEAFPRALHSRMNTSFADDRT